LALKKDNAEFLPEYLFAENFSHLSLRKQLAKLPISFKQFRENLHPTLSSYLISLK